MNRLDRLLTRLLTRLTRPRGTRLLRQLLAEQRLQRLALERLARAVEYAAGTWQTDHTSQPGERAQVFRTYNRVDQSLDEGKLQQLSSVDYPDPTTLALVLETEARLKTLLGREPTEAELERAFNGELDVRESPRRGHA